MRLWEEVRQGARHVVLVQGEAGIGKSRLLHALQGNLLGNPHTIRELRCLPEFSQSPFHAVIVLLESILCFAPDDTPEAKFTKLARYLEAHHPESVNDAVPLLARLLALPLGGHYQAPGFSPRAQKEQTLAIVLGLLHGLAARQPMLLVVEDMHWIDPSTLELLTLFVAQETPMPILAVLTTRPGFAVPWKEGRSTTLALGPLADDQVAELIASLVADIPAAIIRRIVDRADGVPLFAEEMARFSTADNGAGIPITLHDLLAARLDGIGAAKHTAQLAASIGREFRVEILRKISPLAPAALTQTLRELQDAGLVLSVSGTACQFRHALFQEAAYQSQTRAARQATHQRIAQALQDNFADTVETRPEILAQHLTAAGDARQAIEYWIKAGQYAAQRSAYTEAMTHFAAGRQLLVRLPPDQDRDRTEFRLQISLCTVLHVTTGHGSAEARHANARVRALSGRVGDSSELFQANWGLIFSTMLRSGFSDGLESVTGLLGMACDDPVRRQEAHHSAGFVLFWLGEFEAARTHFEQAIALYRPEHHAALVAHFGENSAIASGAFLSRALLFLGFPDQAMQVSERTLAQARQLNHPYSLRYALSAYATMRCWMKQAAEALDSAEEALALSQEHDFPTWMAASTTAHGWALVMRGQAEGITELKASVDIVRAAIPGLVVTFLSTLAESHMHLGQFDEALTVLAATLTEVENKGDRHFEAELLRLKGECLLALSTTNAAAVEDYFNQALAISRKQGAKSLELRAAMSMTRLWQRQNKPEAAGHLLEGVFKGFSEGFDTPDLLEAQRLLDAAADQV